MSYIVIYLLTDFVIFYIFLEPDYGQMGQPMPNLEKLPAPRPPERSSSQTPQKPVRYES